VVVNHALLLTDLVVREVTGGAASMLDEYSVVIFDEAHEVEKYASSTLGSEFKTGGVSHLVSEVRNFGRRHVPARADDLEAAGNAVLTAMTVLFSDLERTFEAARTDKLRIREAVLLEHGDAFVGMANALDDLHAAVADVTLLQSVPVDSYGDVAKRRTRLSRRTASTVARFKAMILASFDDLVRWIERDNRGNLVLKTAPVTVAPYLRENLFEAGVTAVLVSATLAVGGKFDYIAGRLGIDAFDSIDVGTPFDYASQARFYVPTDLPEPTPANRAAWSSLMAARALELVTHSDGRALLLFTSNREMKACYEAIADRIPHRTMIQGERPNKALMEEFKADVHSVLFATASFFTGVDFQGETCSLVVIDKLPFPVPSDPIVEARTDAIKRAGRNDFAEYTIPEMSLVLKQGFGRLIRHRNDTGVFALLDPRVKTKGYGKAIVRSLPPAPLTSNLDDVEEFFARP
jgi:ATP-dependent DNA helicase DinG